MAETHPDFDRAPPSRRWVARLDELRRWLEHDAARSEKRMTWRILPQGALVSLRILGDARLEIRISRSVAPATEKARAAWENELATFVRYLRMEGWTRVDEPAGQGLKGIAAIYTEPAQPGPPRVVDLFGEVAAPRPPSAIEQGR